MHRVLVLIVIAHLVTMSQLPAPNYPLLHRKHPPHGLSKITLILPLVQNSQAVERIAINASQLNPDLHMAKNLLVDLL